MLQPPSSRPYGWNRYNQGRFRLPTSRQSRALAATNNAVLYHETKCHIQELIDTLPTTLTMSRVEDDVESRDGLEPVDADLDALPFRKTPTCKTLQQDLGLIFSSVKKIKTDLNKAMNEGIDNLTELLTDDKEGVIPRLNALETSDESLKSRVASLEEKLALVEGADSVTLQISPLFAAKQDELQHKLETATHVITTLENELHSQESRILYNSQMHNVKSYKISGINHVVGEDPLVATKTFLTDILEVTVQEGDIKSASRIPGTISVFIKGVKTELPPQMSVKVSGSLQKKIARNIRNLDDKSDPTDGHFYKVKQQLPDAMIAARQHFNKIVAKIQEDNDGLPREKRTPFYFQGTDLFVSGRKVREPVYPPSRASILSITPREQSILDLINPPVLSQQLHLKSKFFAYAVRLHDIATVKHTYKRLRQLHIKANHIMMAFGVVSPDDPDKVLEGSCHDRESHGDVRLATVVEKSHMTNVAVFVVRYYGGTPLRGLRLKAITECATEALFKVRFPEEEDPPPTEEDTPAEATSESSPVRAPRSGSSSPSDHTYNTSSPRPQSGKGGPYKSVGSKLRFDPKKRKLDFVAVTMPYNIDY